MKILLLFTFILPLSSAWGSKKLDSGFIPKGFFGGGRPNYFAELKGVRKKTYKKAGVQRWIMDLGMVSKESFSGDFPEYHVSLEPQKNRVKIMLKVSAFLQREEKIKSWFYDSRWVKEVHVFKDQWANKLYVFIDFNKPIKIRLTKLKSKLKTRRLALDVRKESQVK